MSNTEKYIQSKPASAEVREKSAGFEVERKKFATQMDADLLSRLRSYTKSEGRTIQSVLEDAVQAYLNDQQGYTMRSDVKAAYQKSLDRYSSLYEALAK